MRAGTVHGVELVVTQVEQHDVIRLNDHLVVLLDVRVQLGGGRPPEVPHTPHSVPFHVVYDL